MTELMLTMGITAVANIIVVAIGIIDLIIVCAIIKFVRHINNDPQGYISYISVLYALVPYIILIIVSMFGLISIFMWLDTYYN